MGIQISSCPRPQLFVPGPGEWEVRSAARSRPRPGWEPALHPQLSATRFALQLLAQRMLVGQPERCPLEPGTPTPGRPVAKSKT